LPITNAKAAAVRLEGAAASILAKLDRRPAPSAGQSQRAREPDKRRAPEANKMAPSAVNTMAIPASLKTRSAAT